MLNLAHALPPRESAWQNWIRITEAGATTLTQDIIRSPLLQLLAALALHHSFLLSIFSPTFTDFTVLLLLWPAGDHWAWCR